MATSPSQPCVSCIFLHRKCHADCMFAPYFTGDMLDKFKEVGSVFGIQKAERLLQGLSLKRRQVAARSLIYEAHLRTKDPVLGSGGVIVRLRRQIKQLETELASTRSDQARCSHDAGGFPGISLSPRRIPSSSRGSEMNLSGTHVGQEQQQQMVSRDQHLNMECEPQDLTGEQVPDVNATPEERSAEVGEGLRNHGPSSTLKARLSATYSEQLLDSNARPGEQSTEVGEGLRNHGPSSTLRARLSATHKLRQFNGLYRRSVRSQYVWRMRAQRVRVRSR